MLSVELQKLGSAIQNLFINISVFFTGIVDKLEARLNEQDMEDDAYWFQDETRMFRSVDESYEMELMSFDFSQSSDKNEGK